MSSPTISQALLSHGAAFPLEPSAETLMEQMAELRAAVLDSSWEVVAQHALSTAGSSQGSAQALTVGSFARPWSYARTFRKHYSSTDAKDQG